MSIPIGLNPAMGYMLWFMQRGLEPIEAMKQALEQPQFLGISESDMNLAYNEAIKNLYATQRVQSADTNQSIRKAMGL